MVEIAARVLAATPGGMLFIPSVLGSLISGYIYEYSPAYPWYIQSVLLALCLLPIIKLVKEPDYAEV